MSSGGEDDDDDAHWNRGRRINHDHERNNEDDKSSRRYYDDDYDKHSAPAESSDPLSKSLSSRFEPDRRDNRKRRDYNDRNRYADNNDRQRRRHDDRGHFNRNDQFQPNHFSPHQQPPMFYPPMPNGPYPWQEGFPPHPDMSGMNFPMFYPLPYYPGGAAEMPPPWLPYPPPMSDAMGPRPDMFPAGMRPYRDMPLPQNPPPHRIRDENKRSEEASNMTMGYKTSTTSSGSDLQVEDATATSSSHEDKAQLNPLADEYVPTAADDYVSPAYPSSYGREDFRNSSRGSHPKFRGAGRSSWRPQQRGWNRLIVSSNQSQEGATPETAADENDSIAVHENGGEGETVQESGEGTGVQSAKPVVEAKITMENVVMQQKYEDLKKLRSQADDIWKKKESLLQVC
jgi:hypothetical protein